MAFYLVQALNAVSFSVLLLLMGLGLSLVLSLMNFINLAHGSAVLLGAYIGIYWFAAGLPWPLAFLAAFLATAFAGLILERFPLRQFYARTHLMQVLLTYGVSVILADLMRWSFGGQIMTPELPEALGGVVFLFGMPFPVYRLFITVFGLAVAFGLWFLVDCTVWGAVARACMTDRGFVETLGLNACKLFSIVMIISMGFGGLSGALGAGILSAYPGLDEEVLVLSLIVVVVGGLGTFRGTVVSALLLGFTTTFARIWVPEFANFVALAVMAALLVKLPSGLVAQKIRRV